MFYVLFLVVFADYMSMYVYWGLNWFFFLYGVVCGAVVLVSVVQCSVWCCSFSECSVVCSNCV